MLGQMPLELFLWMKLQKAKDYFSSTMGFARLLKAMAQKYQSLGRWGGSVTLTSLKARSVTPSQPCSGQIFPDENQSRFL